MNILQLIVKIRDLIAAFKASDWSTALNIVVELINTFVKQDADPAVRMMASGPGEEAELKACIAELTEAASMKRGDTTALGTLVQTMLTALLVFFKEWFGFA